MSTINEQNYRAFFIDYLEGNLTEDEVTALRDFLQKRPGLAKEFEHIQQTQLQSSGVSYPGKEALKQSIIKIGPIEENNYENYFIGYWEGDLSRKENRHLTAFLAQNPSLHGEFIQFKKSRPLVRPEDRFPHKDKLKSPLRVQRNYQWIIMRKRGVAAAIMALFISLGAFLYWGEQMPRSFLSPEPAKKRVHKGAPALPKNGHSFHFYPLPNDKRTGKNGNELKKRQRSTVSNNSLGQVTEPKEKTEIPEKKEFLGSRHKKERIKQHLSPQSLHGFTAVPVNYELTAVNLSTNNAPEESLPTIAKNKPKNKVVPLEKFVKGKLRQKVKETKLPVFKDTHQWRWTDWLHASAKGLNTVMNAGIKVESRYDKEGKLRSLSIQ